MLTERFRVLMSVVFCVGAFVICACRPSEHAPPPRPLPEFSLRATTSAGGAPRELTPASLRGRVWVADFVFTRCSGPCPLLTANLAALRKALPEGTGLLSVTVDPDHDTLPRLAAYGAKFGAGPEWLFATGEKAALTRLIKEGFLLPVAEDAKAKPGERVAHSTKFVLLDREARIRGWYDGEDPAARERLARDAAALR
jgi:protein SCO1/2